MQLRSMVSAALLLRLNKAQVHMHHPINKKPGTRPGIFAGCGGRI